MPRVSYAVGWGHVDREVPHEPRSHRSTDGRSRHCQAGSGYAKDWRRYLVWIVWAAGLALALASVAKQADDEQYEAELKQLEREQKAAAKASRKRR